MGWVVPVAGLSWSVPAAAMVVGCVGGVGLGEDEGAGGPVSVRRPPPERCGGGDGVVNIGDVEAAAEVSRVMGWERVVRVVPVMPRVPPAEVMFWVGSPRLVLSETESSPPARVMPPEKVLLPERVRVPLQ